MGEIPLHNTGICIENLFDGRTVQYMISGNAMKISVDLEEVGWVSAAE